MKKSATASSPKATAGTRRLEQLASVLQAELGQLLAREVELPPGVLATITRVKVLPDYKEAHVKVSVLPFVRASEVLALLTGMLPSLQHHLNTTLTMFHVPKLVLTLDETPERAGRIEHLLDRLKQ